MELAKRGNERAKELLVKQYDRLIWHLVKRTLYDTQQELHAQCIVRLLECINEFDPSRGAKFGTYIYNQFRAIISFHFSRTKWDSDVKPEELETNPSIKISIPIHHNQPDLILSDMVEKLPEPYRTTIRYLYYDELTMRDVCKLMNVSLRTVHLRAKAGIALLKMNFLEE